MKKLFLKIMTILICFLFLININPPYAKSAGTPKYNILVDLNECTLYLIDKYTNEIIKTYPVAGGKYSSPSPVGTWKIVSMDSWSSGFGTRWMGLNIPWGRYGIHGTNKPYSIGSPSSAGCIRMLNSDVEDLYNKVTYGTVVVIYGGPYGLQSNRFRDLVPGDRGADVYEVQKKLNQQGYRAVYPDGIFGESMKNTVIKFRQDHKLWRSDKIDRQFYNVLGMKPFE